MTESQLLALQGHAVATNDVQLKYLTWEALGYSRVGFEPVTRGERDLAVRRCADRLAFMRMTGETLRSVAP